MAWTHDDLDALSAAIKGGVKSVTFSDGRKTEYQTLKEMLDLRTAMRLELAALDSQVTPRTRTTIGRMRRS